MYKRQVLPGAAAVFLRLDEMTGEGPAAQAGPAAVAQEIGVAWTGKSQVSVVRVDAQTPEGAAAPTRIEVDPPTGPPLELAGVVREWGPPEIGPGPWRVRVAHASGVEGDTIRFAAAHFPFGA